MPGRRRTGSRPDKDFDVGCVVGHSRADEPGIARLSVPRGAESSSDWRAARARKCPAISANSCAHSPPHRREHEAEGRPPASQTTVHALNDDASHGGGARELRQSMRSTSTPAEHLRTRTRTGTMATRRDPATLIDEQPARRRRTSRLAAMRCWRCAAPPRLRCAPRRRRRTG